MTSSVCLAPDLVLSAAGLPAHVLQASGHPLLDHQDRDRPGRGLRANGLLAHVLRAHVLQASGLPATGPARRMAIGPRGRLGRRVIIHGTAARIGPASGQGGPRAGR